MIDVDAVIVARNEQSYTFEYIDPRPGSDIPFIRMEVDIPAVFSDPKQTALVLKYGTIGSRWRLRHSPGQRVELIYTFGER